MYNVTNPKTGKTYTYRNLRSANNLASKFGVKVVNSWSLRMRDGSILSGENEMDWTGKHTFVQRCPHGSLVGHCDRGACDE